MKTKIILFAFFVGLTHSNAQIAWQKMASLPGPGRNHAIGLSHGTNGYVLTGEGPSLMKDFYEYNSMANTWVKLPDYPGPARSYGIGYVVGDKAYVGFGHSSSGFETDWWEYDFITKKWTQKTDFPGPGRDHPGCAILNGKVYVGFGDNASANYKDWWQYDPATDKWTAKTQYPGITMHHPVTAQTETLIYLSEGHLSNGSTNKGSIYFYSYDAITDKWATLANMPGPGVVAGASFYLGDNKVYSGAGITEPASAFHKEFYAYDISAGSWSAIANYPGSGVFGPVSFVIGNSGYVVTGQTSSGSNVQDLYRLSSPLSVMDIASDDGIQVYPNPAISSFTIEGITDMVKMHYSMVNVLGDEVRSGDVYSSGNNFTGNVNINDFPPGLYFLKIDNGRNTTSRKIIIQ
jgi:N-acetylneuraminic acid mutarotase